MKRNWIHFICVLLVHYKISLLFFRKISLQFNIFRIISLPNFVSGEKKTFLSIFLLYFRLASIFSLILPLFSLQIFGVSHRSESCEIRFFFASKRNEIFTSNSNFASEAKVRAHPS
jgi:hypothetical protein